MEVVRLLTRRFEDLVIKYKTVLSQTHTEGWNRPQRGAERQVEILSEMKRRSPDISG
jgi:hypothetical protein